jgi:hypothetical protein
MGSGESKPEKPDIASHDPVEIEAQLMKRQRHHELTELQKMGRFLDDLDFENFNETTSSIIKYLQTLAAKHYGEFFNDLKERLTDHRYHMWLKDVVTVIQALALPEDTEITHDNKREAKMWIFDYIRGKGYPVKRMLYEQFVDCVNMLNFQAKKVGGDTGPGVWHYDDL